MLSQDSLEAAVRAAGIGVSPTYLEQTGSTNTEALERAAAGAPEWTVVAAGHQTAGRGRLGRSWASVPGRSLLFSVVLRPDLPPDRASLVSLLAAERMAAACGVPVRAKWPNDLVVSDRKVAGILPEARVERGRLAHVVIGIGVNVALEPPDLPRGATSLAREGIEVEGPELLARFLTGFRRRLRPRDEDFGEGVIAAYLARCDTIGRGVRAVTTRGEAVEGVASGVDPGGALRIQADGAEQVVGFGEIQHLQG
jgi:BirA family biotin operon repressor/biotin-[acetyl-CoA-carboxylase] ligase